MQTKWLHLSIMRSLRSYHNMCVVWWKVKKYTNRFYTVWIWIVTKYASNDFLWKIKQFGKQKICFNSLVTFKAKTCVKLLSQKSITCVMRSALNDTWSKHTWILWLDHSKPTLIILSRNYHLYAILGTLKSHFFLKIIPEPSLKQYTETLDLGSSTLLHCYHVEVDMLPPWSWWTSP